MYKLAQFADDTTIILDGSVNSLQAALNILEIFGALSGLKINSEKTRLVWIGSEISSKTMLKVSHKLYWGASEFNLLGINFACDLTKMPNLNYQSALIKAKQVVNSWKYRYVTPIGKITIVKTLIISKFTHLFMTLPTPVTVLNDLNKLLFNFIWDGKPDKIKREQMCANKLKGGLNMTNVYNFEKSLKLNWLKQIFTGRTKIWLYILSNDTKLNLNYLSSLGSEWCLSLMPKLNPFWKKVFSYYNHFCQQSQNIKTNEDILCTSIWLNKSLGTEKIFFANWFKHGIQVVGDILNSEGNIFPLEEIEKKFNFTVNVLNYFTMRALTKKYISMNGKDINFDFRRPHIPMHIRALLGSSTKSKHVYLKLQQNESCIQKHEQKWTLDLHLIEPTSDSWSTIYKICFHTLRDNTFIWFQYRVLHRILGVQQLLYKIKLSNTENCRLCNEHSETILHLFSDCQESNNLWKNVTSWINTSLNMQLHLDMNMKILGNIEPGPNFWPLNFILLVTRHYIFTRAKKFGKLNIYHLQSILKKIYSEQEALSKLENNNKFFEKIWSCWKNLYKNI